MSADISISIKDWSTTEGSNAPLGTTSISQNLDDNLRTIQAAVRYLMSRDTIASATTCDIGSKDAFTIDITGTTAITGLGTVSAGILKCVVFAGVLTLTYNGTSLKLPTSADITTAAGDSALMISLGSGNWECLSYSRRSGSPLVVNSLGDGTVSLPALAFSADLNTGLYRIGSDSLGISAGGSLVATFAATGIDLASPATKHITLTSGINSSGTDAGDINLVGGGANSGNAEGGDINLTAGASNGTSGGGDIALVAGQGGNTGAGGVVQITAGAPGTASSGNGGDITLTGGSITDNALSGDGGDIILRGGAASTTQSSASGGHVILRPGDAYTDGQVKFQLVGLTDALSVLGSNGHIEVVDASGSPTISSGAGTGATIAGTDTAFRVTLGTTPTTSVVIAFAATWTNAPICLANYGDTNIAVRCTPTTTGVTITFASTPTATKTLEVFCIGRRAT